MQKWLNLDSELAGIVTVFFLLFLILFYFYYREVKDMESKGYHSVYDPVIEMIRWEKNEDKK